MTLNSYIWSLIFLFFFRSIESLLTLALCRWLRKASLFSFLRLLDLSNHVLLLILELLGLHDLRIGSLC